VSRRILILGATSAIAAETARLWARDGDALFLVARDEERLRVVGADLGVRGAARVDGLAADLNDIERHEAILDRATEALDGLDTVLLAQGKLGGPDVHRDVVEARQVLETNLLAPVSILTRVAERFERQGSGAIVGISSVAGDRGRASNYVYGASKAGLSVFLQGLRNRLHGTGVRVLTIKPGLVDTPMTAHLPRGILAASPRTVARGIHRALAGRRDVIYSPWFWRWIMLVIRLVPEPIFKRTRL
jgi:short-subunit dehydrogenase